jgi:hypothetical protein
MRTNPLLMIQTRYTARPLHKQFILSLTKNHWVGSQADFAVAINGPYIPLSDEDKLVGAARVHNQCQHVLDLRNSGTSERLPPFLRQVLGWGMSLGYPYIGVFDDDARYTKPMEAARDYCMAFDTHPYCGGVGPMGGLRKQWRYRLDEGRDPNFMEPLERCPWACLGSQIYRAEALQTINLSFLAELKFRADAIIAMLLVGKGWGNYEMDIKFDHVVSAGLDGNYEDDPQARVEFHERRIAQVSHDYAIYRRELNSQTPHAFVQRVAADLRRLEDSERRHNEKKLRMAQEWVARKRKEDNAYAGCEDYPNL